MVDFSDEMTGLPPLEAIDPDDAIVAYRVLGGVESLVILPEYGATKVGLLSVRGLVNATDENGEKVLEWGQVHIAIPQEMLKPLLQEWLEKING